MKLTALAVSAALFGPVAVLAQQSGVQPEPVPAYVTQTGAEGGQSRLLYISGSSETAIEAGTNPEGGGSELSLAEVSVHFPQPPEYAEGIQAYVSGDFEGAAEQFEACARKYAYADKVPLNYSSLGRYYYAQCMRHLESWSRLREVIEPLDPELLPEGFQAQVALYPLWLAYGEESWDQLKGDIEALEMNNLYPALRSQVGFLSGRAMEETGDQVGARVGYNAAFTLNYQADPALARMAADRLIALYLADEGIQQTLEIAEELPPSDPRRRLLAEAASVVYLYPEVLAAGAEPPAGSEVFLPYLNVPGTKASTGEDDEANQEDSGEETDQEGEEEAD